MKAIKCSMMENVFCFVCFQTYIPSQSNKVGISPGSPSKSAIANVASHLPTPTVLPSVHEVNIFRSFAPIISHVHLLWELVLTAEPIVVMASSPTTCSEMVHSLVRLVLLKLQRVPDCILSPVL